MAGKWLLGGWWLAGWLDWVAGWVAAWLGGWLGGWLLSTLRSSSVRDGDRACAAAMSMGRLPSVGLVVP